MEGAQAARFALINPLHAIGDGRKPMVEKLGKGGGSGRNVGHRGGGCPGASREGLPFAAAEKDRELDQAAERWADWMNRVLWSVGAVWILWQLLM